jgi:DNA-binding response OmpR family regulator
MKNRRRSVLIAEAHRETAQGLRFHLERAGFSVFVAHDGEQASILAARQRFELIVVNLELPKIDGAEFCRHVREDLRLEEVPIFACSAEGAESDFEDLMLDLRISRVFCSPINPTEVVQFARETVHYLVAAS